MRRDPPGCGRHAIPAREQRLSRPQVPSHARPPHLPAGVNRRGRAAFWCARLGLGPITIIDLPHVALVEAWYLVKALPDLRVWLFGESQDAGATVSIYPDAAIGELPEDVALVFNQDSLPEMST